MTETTAPGSRLKMHRGYDVFRCRDSYPGEQTLHHHDFYEVNLFYSGNMEYGIESRTYHLTTGDVLLISPNELHQPVAQIERGSCERIVLWLEKGFLQQFQDFGVDLTGCFDTKRPEHSNCLRFDDDTTMKVIWLLERCMQEREQPDFGAEMMADTTLIQVMILLNRLSQRSGSHSRMPDKSGTLVTNVLEYINGHYAEELTLDGLANKFFISKYHLSREFGRLVGTSVHRYIIQKRLVIAKQLLSEGVPSSAVYQHCGFGDYSNFYRAFKSVYGISPKEYVANLQTDNARNAERARLRGLLTE